MNPNTTNKRIKELHENTYRPVENAPDHQIIGTDGSGWYQQVGHDHDRRSNSADLAELRTHMRQKIASQLNNHKNRPQIGLFRMLELAIVRSDWVVFRTVELVGVKPSNGLYEKIKEILVTEDNLDPNSELWKLFGV